MPPFFKRNKMDPGTQEIESEEERFVYEEIPDVNQAGEFIDENGDPFLWSGF